MKQLHLILCAIAVSVCTFLTLQCMEQQQKQRTLVLHGTTYNLSDEALKHGGHTLESATNNSLLLPMLERYIKKHIWEQVIYPALNEGQSYVLPENQTYEDLLAIMQTSDLVEIPLVTTAAAQQLAILLKNKNFHDARTMCSYKSLLTQSIRTKIASYIIDKPINRYAAITNEKLFCRYPDYVNALAYSTDGRLLASSSNGVIYINNVASGKRLTTITRHSEMVHALVFNHDNTMLASSSLDNTVQIRNIDPKNLGLPLMHYGNYPYSPVFSPDGKLWAVPDGTQVTVYYPTESRVYTHTSKIHVIQFTPDGTKLIGVSDTTLVTWDITQKSPEPVLCYKFHNGFTNCVALSKNGELYAAGLTSKEIMVWNTHTHELLGVLKGHNGKYMNFITFNTDGTLLASCSPDDMTCCIWDVTTMSLWTTIQYSEKLPITRVAFSPDMKSLAGYCGKEVIIWQLKDYNLSIKKALAWCYLQKELGTKVTLTDAGNYTKYLKKKNL